MGNGEGIETMLERGVRCRLALAGAVVAVGAMCFAAPAAMAASPRVLRVGTFRGKRGGFSSIQAAVDAARPGDWILVGPGDYHERADHRANRGAQPKDTPAGVVITKAGLHLRGMNRNRVIVDGTAPGGRACSASPGRQDLGVASGSGRLGRNGIVVWKTDDVSIENLTVCNFLTGSASSGNEIWWNGGDGGGSIGLHGYTGNYLTTTSTFFGGESTAAAYGLFTSNTDGGSSDHTYASNFNDSGYYIGACQQVCNQRMTDAHAQFSALGYSGTNAGGSIVVTHSEFDHNRDGFDTNSQNNDDRPSPQNGACPNGAISPITHTHSCWVFEDNDVHDNNNANVPGAGAAGSSPIGTGLSISGGRNNTIMHNRFARNGAWGVVFLPYPDNETPPAGEHCQGGAPFPPFACLFDDSGNALVGNTFTGNGTFGNPTNGDFGEITFREGPSNCFRDNTRTDGSPVVSSPTDLQQTKTTCGGTVPANPNGPMTTQALCATGLAACPPGANYPQQTKVVMHPLPKGLRTMPNPCAGVPANPWCPARRSAHFTG